MYKDSDGKVRVERDTLPAASRDYQEKLAELFGDKYSISVEDLMDIAMVGQPDHFKFKITNNTEKVDRGYLREISFNMSILDAKPVVLPETIRVQYESIKIQPSGLMLYKGLPQMLNTSTSFSPEQTLLLMTQIRVYSVQRNRTIDYSWKDQNGKLSFWRMVMDARENVKVYRTRVIYQ
ncbi:MAG: hypothetical protein JW774_00910 [Candidatus Aureabacteria bacterium]|nr:hypothetical protein [Candidatus Auribacterota bacterium]